MYVHKQKSGQGVFCLTHSLTLKLKSFKFLSIFISLFLFLFVFPKVASATTYPKLEHYNAVVPILTSSDGNNWLYGYRNVATELIRMHEDTQSYSTMSTITGIDANFQINDVFATSTTDLIFVLVKNTSTNNYYIYRSTDGGATLSKVLTLGEGNGPGGSDATNVFILKGFLEVKTNYPGTSSGVGDLYIGEYNINTSRTNGGDNDRVRILKSTDDGVTWTAIMNWNTSGHQIRHVHSISQDPYTGYIYITTGDGTIQNNIIRWDGVSSWVNNFNGAEINATSGFNCIYGLERYRTTQLIFDENYLYSFADGVGSANHSELGIWKGSKDLSSFERVNSDVIDNDDYHVGWYGENVNGTLIFTTSPEYVDATHTWEKSDGRIYTSSDGNHWKAVATYNFRGDNPNTSLRLGHVFQYNNKLYLNSGNPAGPYITDILSVDGNFNGDLPTIIHPVFYVGTWNSSGSDSNNGYTKDAPKLTLGNLLTGDRITYGTRVRIASGTYNEGGITPEWDSYSSPGSTLLSTVIEGQGMSQTNVIKSSGTDSFFIINSSLTGSSSSVPVIFKNISLSNITSGNASVFNLLDGSGTEVVNTQVGDPYETDYDLVEVATNAYFSAKDSILMQRVGASNGNCIGFTGTGNSSVSLQYSILNNCVVGVKQKYAGTTLSVLNTIFKNYLNRGVLVDTDVTTAPTVKNSVFVGADGSSPIEDNAGLTETNINNNYYSHNNIDITDGGNSLSVGSGPKFTGGNEDVTGTVSRVNIRASYVNGSSFVDFSSADTLTSYVGSKIYLVDTSGKRAIGYIKLAGTGETYGNDLITDVADREFSSDTGWWTLSGWSIAGGVATHTQSTYSNLSRANLLTLGSLYKTVSSTSSTVNLGLGTYLQGVNGSNITKYGVAAGNYNLTYGTTNSGITLDNVSVKQVTAPSVTGVTITSTENGSTYNWQTVDPSFNYNDTSYSYRIIQDYDYTLLFDSHLINSGTSVGLTSDYAGNTVPQGSAPDIGVYEFLLASSPSSLSQTISGSGSSSTFTMSMSSTNTTDSLTPQIEIQRIGTDFTNTPNYSGGAVTSTSGSSVTGTVSATLGSGKFHWQARVSNAAGQSSWLSYGGNSESDADIDIPFAAAAPPQCNDSKPSSAPWLYSATAKSNTSVFLQFTKVENNVDKYAIEYGLESGEHIYAIDNINGASTTEYLVKDLQPNTTYYFRVRAGNSCATGDWSNEISVTTSLASAKQLKFTETTLEPVISKELKSCQQYIVQSGDNLWNVAKSEFGDGALYTKIIELNKENYPSLVTSNNLEVGWKLNLCSPEAQKQETETTNEQVGYAVNVKVTNTNQEPVKGATVTIHSKVQKATTDENGIASFENVEPGDHKVLIAYSGYEGEQNINLTGDVKEFNLNITVEVKPFSLSPLAYAIIGILGLVILSLVIFVIKLKRNRR